MKRDFNPPTIKKIKIFLERFKKDPTQQVTSLCKKISLSKTLLYDYLRTNNLSLDKLRNSPKMKREQNKKPTQKIERASHNTSLTHAQMKTLVDEIDEQREQGMELAEASKKVGIHFSTYYNYKRKLQNKGVTKRKYTRRDINNDDVPNFPHTIIYSDKPEKPTNDHVKDLDVMIELVELVLRYMKKARG